MGFAHVMLERQLENIPPGLHACAIFRAPAERLQLLVGFFGGGLGQGQQCLYVADPDAADELTRALRELGPSVRTELDRGALVSFTTREQYTRDGHFDARAMLARHAVMSRRALSNGFSAVRIAGEMSWVFGQDMGTRSFLELEALVNDSLAATGGSGICLYDWRRTPSTVLRDVLRTHPVAIIGERVHDNVYYEPAEVVLDTGDVDQLRVDWMVRRLEARTSPETAVFDVGRLLLEGASPRHLMRAAPAMIGAELGFDYVELFELLPRGDAMRLMGSSGLGLGLDLEVDLGVDKTPRDSIEPLDPDSLFADAALSAGRPVVVYDWRDGTRDKLPAQLREAGITSSVAIVIGTGQGERGYGYLSAHSRAPRIFSDNEILFLETVGHLVASALVAARGEQLFRALVETAPEAVVRFDEELRITYANPASERATGILAESLIGKTSRDLGVLEPLITTWELVLRQVWRTGREEAFDVTLRTPLGERVFASRIVTEAGPDGSVQSLLTISRHVTDERRAEAERSALYRQLVAQQNQVHMLMSRLAHARERRIERSAVAAQIRLTDRERHILRLLAAGWTNQAIAAELGLTPGTVKNHVGRILPKLNVADRTQAAVRAVELGLVPGSWASQQD